MIVEYWYCRKSPVGSINSQKILSDFRALKPIDKKTPIIVGRLLNPSWPYCPINSILKKKKTNKQTKKKQTNKKKKPETNKKNLKLAVAMQISNSDCKFHYIVNPTQANERKSELHDCISISIYSKRQNAISRAFRPTYANTVLLHHHDSMNTRTNASSEHEIGPSYPLWFSARTIQIITKLSQDIHLKVGSICSSPTVLVW